MNHPNHIMVAASYRWPMYAPAFCSALQRTGIRITCFDFDQYLNNSLARFEIRTGLGFHITVLNMALRLAVFRLRPQVCLIWTGLGVWPSTVNYIAKRCWVTSYTNDDPFGPRGQKYFWRLFRQALPNYHSHHVYRDINVPEYKNLGIDNVGLLRSYYVPTMHYFESIEPSHDEYPIVFIGHGEPNRIEVITAIANSGLPVAVFGPGATWHNLDLSNKMIHFYPGGLEATDYRLNIASSSICLGFLSRENRDDYTRRYFEIPACRGFLLAERTEFASRLYVEGKEVEYFSAASEAVRKCQLYFNAPTLRHRIAEAGQKRCYESGYDVNSRANDWLKDIIKFQK